jgi:hypothetical protein
VSTDGMLDDSTTIGRSTPVVYALSAPGST